MNGLLFKLVESDQFKTRTLLEYRRTTKKPENA
nr:MAG TPA: hypothetical protein [Caudoviricetes sp.]